MRSRALYEGDGETRLYAVPFPYLSVQDVKVYLNKFPLNNPYDFKFVGDNMVELTKAPKENDAIEVARVTPESEALVKFQNGSVLTEDELNTAIVQLLYLLQETRDYYDAVLGDGFQRIAGSTAILGATAEDIINAVIQDVLNDELTAYLQQRISDINLNSEDLMAQRLRMDTVEELVAALSNVGGESIATFLINEQTARIEGDVALAETIALLGAKSGDGLAFILDMNKVKVSPTESFAQRLSVMQSQMGNNTALIGTESTTRATADQALATQISEVSAEFEENLAVVGQQITTLADADQAFAQQINSLVAQVEDAEAMIVAEQTVRATADTAATTRMNGMQSSINNTNAVLYNVQETFADADYALSQQIGTLQTTLNGHTTSIQQQASSIDGLRAQYTVKIDNNGYVSGFGLASTPVNGVPFSTFTVLADRFAIVTPGQSPTVPFAVDAQGVYMPNAFIRNLTVDRITGGNISSLWYLNNSSGRIVLDTGTYMKVIGVGFGALQDLIEWFGPKMAINQCRKSNGITWVGMNGDAYFGGSLTAGTLYNAAHTTNTQNNAEVVVGPFTTNGGPKTIVVSYSFDHNQRSSTQSMGSNFSLGSGTTSVTIQLFRQIGIGTATMVAQQTIVGNVDILNEPDGPDACTHRISGSFTYTDNAGLGDRILTARIVARTEQTVTYTGGTIVSNTTTQKLGVISTEE